MALLFVLFPVTLRAMFFDPVTQYPFPKPQPAARPSMSAKQQEAITRERHALALEMRKYGYSFEQIGEHFECSAAAARSLVKGAMDKAIREAGQEVIDMELERLDQLYRLSMNAAVGGDTDGIAKCLNIMARRAKLLGLDAPEKKEVTGANGGAIQLVGIQGLSDDELAAMKALIEKAAGDATQS